MMMKLSIVLSSLLFVIVDSQGEEDVVDLSPLGTNDLSPLNYEYTLEVDGNCDYTMTTKFSHNRDFPVGTAETCLPGVDAPEDNLPILSSRYRWESFPYHVTAATGYDHLSLDFNPCGHPTGGFLTPHYDLHFYKVTPEFRAVTMNCVLLPGTPACLADAQDTPEGNAFFTVAKSVRTGEFANMPKNFSASLTDAVINMGMHNFHLEGAPDDPTDWVEPTYVEVTYDGQIICVEPMLPFVFTDGEEDKFYEQDFEYVEQTIHTLPYYYSVEYDAANHVTTVIMKGPSDLCKAEYQNAMDNPPQDDNNGANGSNGSSGGGTASSRRLLIVGAGGNLVLMVSATVMTLIVGVFMM